MQPTRTRIVMVSAAGKNTFSGEQVARLQQAGEVTFHEATAALDVGDLGLLLADATVAGLTPRSVPLLDAGIVAGLPASLRGVAVFATGVDFADLPALAARGIAVSNLPDYSAVSVAEHTVGLLLTLSRRLHLSRDRVMGRVPAETSVRGWQVAGKTIGVVGVGRIGQRVAAMAHALGMRVLAVDPRGHELGGVRRCELDEVLASAEVVSLHLPAVHDGPPLLGRAEITALRPGAVVINTSRARLVDEAAMVAAVRCGRVLGYAVDDRLRDRDAAARLIAEGRIIETGHTAWYSQEALDRGLDAWVDNVTGLAQGRPRNLVVMPPPRVLERSPA